LPDVDDALYVDWIDFINKRFYQWDYSLNPNDYISEQSITTVDGTQEYTLSSDFETTRPFGCGLYTTDSDGNITTTQFLPQQKGSTLTGFYLSKRNSIIGLTPIPSTVETYILRYIPQLTTLTDITDTTLIEDRYREFVKSAGRLYFEIWNANGGSGQAVLADQDYIRQVDDMLSNLLQTEPTVYTW